MSAPSVVNIVKPRPDSPCIAVCTTLYDEVCKGCGRTYIEVAHWNAMDADQKEIVWQRIDAEGTAWRYNQYKDRVVPPQFCEAHDH